MHTLDSHLICRVQEMKMQIWGKWDPYKKKISEDSHVGGKDRIGWEIELLEIHLFWTYNVSQLFPVFLMHISCILVPYLSAHTHTQKMASLLTFTYGVQII